MTMRLSTRRDTFSIVLASTLILLLPGLVVYCTALFLWAEAHHDSFLRILALLGIMCTVGLWMFLVYTTLDTSGVGTHKGGYYIVTKQCQSEFKSEDVMKTYVTLLSERDDVMNIQVVKGGLRVKMRPSLERLSWASAWAPPVIVFITLGRRDEGGKSITDVSCGWMWPAPRDAPRLNARHVDSVVAVLEA